MPSVTIRIPSDLLARIDAIAGNTDLNRSDITRLCLSRILPLVEEDPARLFKVAEPASTSIVAEEPAVFKTVAKKSVKAPKTD